jgi:hypothetical protein
MTGEIPGPPGSTSDNEKTEHIDPLDGVTALSIRRIHNAKVRATLDRLHAEQRQRLIEQDAEEGIYHRFDEPESGAADTARPDEKGGDVLDMMHRLRRVPDEVSDDKPDN